MTFDRYLGAAFASVHGPSQARDLALWTLNAGFAGLLPGPAPRPIRWDELRQCATDLPFSTPAVRVCALAEVDGRADAGLASANAGERATAVAAIRGAVELAIRLGVRHILLEPGQVRFFEVAEHDLSAGSWTKDKADAEFARRQTGLNRGLDLSCRTLYELCKTLPDMVFCVGPSRSLHGLGEPEALSAMFEDLASLANLRFWHEPAVAAERYRLLGEEQGEWLERFAPRMAGITLGDSADGQFDLPPGAGSVDFSLLASYGSNVGRKLPLVVELDAGVDPSELPGVHSFLDKFGL